MEGEKGIPRDAEDLVAHKRSFTVTCGITLQRAEEGLLRHKSRHGNLWKGQICAVYQCKEDKTDVKFFVLKAHTGADRHTVLTCVCSEGKYPRREKRLCLVFCCPWLLLTAGQHISLC